MIVVYCANLLYIQTRQFEFDDRQFLEGRQPKFRNLYLFMLLMVSAIFTRISLSCDESLS